MLFTVNQRLKSKIQSRIEQLASKICNDVCQGQQNLLKYEKLNKELFMMPVARTQYSGPRLNGLKKERPYKIVFLTLRKETMKKDYRTIV